MRKTLLKVFATLFMGSMLVLGLSACGEKVENHICTHTSTVTPPTCMENGYTTHTCECGDRYVDAYVDALGHDFGEYVADENTINDGMLTARCKREGCNSTDDKQKDGIMFKTLTAYGTSVYGKVSNATETFSFAEEINAFGTAKFAVALDIYGKQTVATKMIPLTVGDNTAYIIETIDGELAHVYTVTVRRRPIYQVTFDFNDDATASVTQTVEEDSFATEPSAMRAGYTFAGWDYDLTNPITKSIRIFGSWITNTNTPYTVEYYLQNLEGNNYTLYEVKEFTGITDTTATAKITEYPHFTHKASTSESGNIHGDGSLILKVYYTRNQYTLSYTGNGNITNIGTYKYGKKLTSIATFNLGYEVGWYNEDKLLSSATEYTFIIDKNITAKITVKEEMQIFNFSSTLTTCTITGVNSSFSKIIIPDYVTSIGSSAFEECTSLTDITIPNNVTSIGLFAFKGCTSLTDITIPNGITSIGASAFEGCTSLTYTIKNNLKYLGNSSNPYLYLADTISTDITSTSIESSCKIIGYSAFEDCWTLKNITIPNGITSIGNSAFQNCSNLTSVSVPNSITSIGASVFNSCESLTNITIPEGVTSIGNSAFKSCWNLKNITIPNSVTSIGSDAFSGCLSLTSIVIPNNVTSIGSHAFYGCTITNVTIGNGISSIGSHAFYSCRNLKNITFKGSVQQWNSIKKEFHWNYDVPATKVVCSNGEVSL